MTPFLHGAVPGLAAVLCLAGVESRLGWLRAVVLAGCGCLPGWLLARVSGADVEAGALVWVRPGLFGIVAWVGGREAAGFLLRHRRGGPAYGWEILLLSGLLGGLLLGPATGPDPRFWPAAALACMLTHALFTPWWIDKHPAPKPVSVWGIIGWVMGFAAVGAG